MKRILTLCLFFAALSAFAQDLVPDAAFTFSDVVPVDSIGRDVLYHDAMRWLRSEKDKIITIQESDSTNGKITASASYLVYSQPGILAKVSGRINYDLTVEVKDNKYRYVFSNFIYHYYKQDRNYKWVDNGQKKPLRETKATGWQKLWNQHRATAASKVTMSVASLKSKVAEQKENAKTKEKKKVEW